MAFPRLQMSFDKAGIKERALCPVFTRACLSLDPANRYRWIIKRAGNLAATWKQASLELSPSPGVVGLVCVMHRTAEIQQHSLRWTQKKTNKTVMGTKRCLKQLQCHPREIQNKVIKGKLLHSEHCSRITGFLCWNLLPEESCQFWNMPSFRKIAFRGNFLTWSIWAVGVFF